MDAHEERNMWNSIVTDIKKLKQINAKAAEISTQVVDIEAKIGSSRSWPVISSDQCFPPMLLCRSFLSSFHLNPVSSGVSIV